MQGTEAGPALVRFERVTKRFGAFTAVRELTLEILRGEFLALLGPSGCGKTTLLRLLAGFETPDAGRILIEGSDLAGVPPHRRPLNTVFQNYALFPHLTVAANVGFGLRYDGLTRTETAERVREMLALVRLDGLEQRKPDQLSGGQRQRVALARALAKRPRLLLLDEPMAALDRKLRESTQRELVDIQRKLGTTFVIVTHDQDEAMTVADRIAVMQQGEIAQLGPPATVYEHPQSRYVADFLGDVNLLEGVLAIGADGRGEIIYGALRFQAAVPLPAEAGSSACFAIRPEKIRLQPEGASETEGPAEANSFDGVVVDASYRGDASRYRVVLDGGLMLSVQRANITSDGRPIARGDRVRLSFAPDAGTILVR